MIAATEDSLKHQQVYDRLMTALSSGNFQIGERLPSEREFAGSLGVHISTVRRAFRELVLGGIVEKRIGSGTYLAQHPEATWYERPVNLILDGRIGPTVQRQLSYLCTQTAERRGRKCRILYTGGDDLPELLRSCLTYRQPTILCGNFSEAGLLQENPGLFVSLSSMLYLEGIPTVRCDDALGISLLVRHLQRHGHRRIAFLCTGSGRIALEDFQAAAWVAELGADYDPALKITFDREEGFEISRTAFKAVAKAVTRLAFTALLCVQDEMLLGAMAALREAGKRIPEDISTVSIGNQPLSEYANPPVSCVDPNQEAHLETAFDLLDHNHAHPDSIDTFRLVRPILIERKSVSDIQ